MTPSEQFLVLIAASNRLDRRRTWSTEESTSVFVRSSDILIGAQTTHELVQPALPTQRMQPLPGPRYGDHGTPPELSRSGERHYQLAADDPDRLAPL